MEGYYDELGVGSRDASRDVKALLERDAPVPTGLETTIASMDKVMTPLAVSRLFDRRSSQFKEEPGWKLDPLVALRLQMEYNIPEEKYLTESKSEQEYLARKGHIEQDRATDSVLARSGISGVAGVLVGSIVDVPSVLLGMGTGGIGWGSKLTGFAKAARVAALTGVENAAIETVLMKSDTQSSVADVALAFGAGAFIGGVLSPLTRSANPGLAHASDMADEAVRIDAEHMAAGDLVNKMGPPTALVKESHVGDISHFISEGDTHVDNLGYLDRVHGEGKYDERAISSRIIDMDESFEEAALTKNDISEAKKELDVIEAKIKEESVKPGRDEVLTNLQERAKFITDQIEGSKPLHAVSSSELNKELIDISYSIKKVEGSVYAAELPGLQERQRDIELVLSAQKEAVSKKITRAKWEKLSRSQKAIVAFGKEPLPLLKAELAKQTENIKKTFAKEDLAVKEPASQKLSHTLDKARKTLQEISDNMEPALRNGLVDELAADGSFKPSSVAENPDTPFAMGAMAAGEKRAHIVYDIREKTKELLLKFARDGADVPDDLMGIQFLGKSGFAKMVYATHTVLSNSKSLAIRGFVYHFLDAPQGGTANAVTVASRVRNDTIRIGSAGRGKLHEGLNMYLKENNLGSIKKVTDPEVFSSFHKMVMIECQQPGTFKTPSIVHAAEGVRDELRMGGKLNRESGVLGFENIDENAPYMMVINDYNNIKLAMLDHRHGPAKVKEVISKAYQNGLVFKSKGKKLDPAAALEIKETGDMIADAIMARAKENTLSIQDAFRRVSGKDIDVLTARLKKAGVADDVIENFMQSTIEKEAKMSISDRAKMTLKPDLSVEARGLRYVDMVNSDLPRLLESYKRDAAGAAAWARLGFPTKQSVLNFVADLEKFSINSGHNPKEVAEEIQMLKDCVELSYGRSINADPNSKLLTNARRARDITRLMRLQFNGVSSIPELARITAQRGVGTALRAVKSLGVINTKHLREGGKMSGQFKRPDLRELNYAFGYIGEDHVMINEGLRLDNLEETGYTGRFGAFLDRAIAKGKDIQEITSGFRTIQGGGEKLAMRCISLQIKDWVDGVGKGLREANVREAGWIHFDDAGKEVKFLDEVKTWMDANKKYEAFEGENYRLFNFEKMPADMQERLQIGMQRLVYTDMQRANLGQTPLFMHKWMGQTLTQFRGFAISSLEKQLVRDIRQDKMAGGIIAVHSAMMAYMGLSVQLLHQNIGKEDAEEKIKEQLTGRNLAVNILNRMGQPAFLTIAMDMADTVGALPDEFKNAPGHPGGRALSGDSIPILGMAKDITKVPKTIADFILGDEDSERKPATAGNVVRSIVNVLPLGKTIGINQGFNYIEELLDNK